MAPNINSLKGFCFQRVVFVVTNRITGSAVTFCYSIKTKRQVAGKDGYNREFNAYQSQFKHQKD